MDFLTFKSFISIEVLILFYYVGAIIMPVGMWFFSTWLLKNYNIIEAVYESKKQLIWNALDKNQKAKIAFLFIICFLFMELFWRMMFEFLIAYMQMRDALLQIQI